MVGLAHIVLMKQHALLRHRGIDCGGRDFLASADNAEGGGPEKNGPDGSSADINAAASKRTRLGKGCH